MNNYESQSNDSADCHLRPRFSHPDRLAGFTVTTAGPSPTAPARVHARLVEAGLPAERFVNLQDGTKEPTASPTDPANQFGAEHVDGNYGILAGSGLIVIDVDHPDKLPTWMVHLLAQNPTFAVSSPHGSEARRHYFYRVEGTVETEKTFLKDEWGSIRLEGAYAVGPGSVIDHDEYCDDCSLAGLGEYEPRARSIETLQANAFEPTLPDERAEAADSRASIEIDSRNNGIKSPSHD